MNTFTTVRDQARSVLVLKMEVCSVRAFCLLCTLSVAVTQGLDFINQGMYVSVAHHTYVHKTHSSYCMGTVYLHNMYIH